MINRNRNSAVDRARAEMQQAVNSSRRPLDSARIGRTKEVKVIQGNYGYGWDDLVTYDKDDYAECKRDLHDYCVNEPHANHRVIFRRVPNPDYVEKEKVVDESVEVSSSRRSANRLNSSRYTKDKMIRAMEAAGYYYDDIDSDDANYVVFNGEYGTKMTFDNLNEVADWLDGVVFDDPEVSDTVEAILNSNRRVNSSRHMSYKTRKAVEYSINCARRRARYTGR